jgi:hypothetical protein
MDKSRIAELKSALATRVDAINLGMSEGVKIDGANVEVSAEDAAKIRGLMAEATEIKTLIDAEKFGVETKAWLDAPVEQNVSLDASSVRTLRKSLGEAFTESPEFKALLASGGVNMAAPFEIEAYDLPRTGMGRKDVYSAMNPATYDRVLGDIQFDAMVPRAHRRARVRDLFPTVTTTANLIDYFKVTGYAAGGDSGMAASVPDYDQGNFGLKPKSALQFASAQAPVRTIAHWEAAHRNVLDDVPAMQAVINNELLYGLALEEDRQILSGSGQDDELLGILNTPNIQTYTQLESEQKADTLRRALTKVMLAYYEPTGFVIHPYDWEDVELQKGSGDGQYMLVTNVSVGAEARVWRQPVVETAAISEGTFLTGAFGLGATLYDRQQANVRIAEQHADFFVRNAMAVLAEERLALACKRPESFVRGTFTEVTPLS